MQVAGPDQARIGNAMVQKVAGAMGAVGDIS